MKKYWLAIFCLTLVGCDNNEGSNGGLGYGSLADTATFPIGAAIQVVHLGQADYVQLLDHAFSSLTAEYQMKQDILWPSQAGYNWTETDAITNFAQDHNMQVHGHALVWYQSTPTWLENFSGDGAAFEALIRDYIHAVVGRYKGKVASWDVVNEALDDVTGALRNDVYHQKMGPDYIAKCFQFAREADPDVLLFYNDYGTPANGPKRQAMLALVDDFLARNIPIDGVGLQMHITNEWPQLAQIQETMDALVARGMKVHISELDVRVNAQQDLTELTEVRSQAQKARVKAVVQAFVGLPRANQYAISVWGIRDPDSWIQTFFGQDWPLLFDLRLDPKPAYFGFLEALP